MKSRAVNIRLSEEDYATLQREGAKWGGVSNFIRMILRPAMSEEVIALDRMREKLVELPPEPKTETKVAQKVIKTKTEAKEVVEAIKGKRRSDEEVARLTLHPVGHKCGLCDLKRENL